MTNEDIFGLKPIVPVKIAVVGKQCSGKTTLVNAINERLGNCAKVVKFADPIYSVLNILNKKKNRRFMQGFGTLAMQCFGEDVFCSLFSENIKSLEESSKCCGFLCDDVRRYFEYDTAIGLGFMTVFVDTPVEVRKKRAKKLNIEFIENHESEMHVDSMKKLCNMNFNGNVPLKTMHSYADAILIYANTVFETDLSSDFDMVS